MNKHLNYFIYLICYVTFFSILDFNINKFYNKIWNKKNLKEKIKLIFYLITHNIIFFIIYFTLFYIFVFYKIIDKKFVLFYLFILIFVVLHWITNNNQCWLTVQQNKLLEISKDYGFRDFYTILTNTYPRGTGSMNIRDKIYYSYLIFAFISSIIILFIK